MTSTRTMGRGGATLRVLGWDGSSLGAGTLGGAAPLGFAAGDANLYRYVANGPLDSFDSTGLAAEILPYGSPGAPAPLTITGNPTVQAQLEWFRRRSVNDGRKQREESGWILYNTCSGKYILTVDGGRQDSKHRSHIDNLPSIITPDYTTGDPATQPGDPPDNGPNKPSAPPGYPPGAPQAIGACWVAVATFHTHTDLPRLSIPGDLNGPNKWKVPVIVQWGAGKNSFGVPGQAW